MQQAAEAPRPERAVFVAVSSAVVAIVLGVLQHRPLGDDPVAMIVSGCGLAAFAGAMRLGRPALIGLAAMVGFPIQALIDLVRHGGHNLLPLEFAFYAAYGALGVLVAYGARAARAWILRT